MKTTLFSVLCAFVLVGQQSFGQNGCITSPVLTCPSSYFGCPADGLDPSVTGMATAIPGDPNCPDPTITFENDTLVYSDCYIEIHRVWKASYMDGVTNQWLYAMCVQIIVLSDNNAPVVSNCPGNITIDLSQNCDYTATWTAPSATDDCGLESLTSNFNSGDAFPDGITEVVYTATDNCSNTATCSFTVNVTGSCCAAPQITCPPDRFPCPVTGSTDPSVTGYATATASDPSCGTPLISYADVILSTGPCTGQMEIERIWTATDPNDPSLASSCSQLLHVRDLMPPVISAVPPDITLNGTGSGCSVVGTWTPPTASDNCSVQSLTSNYNSGDAFPEGTTMVVYTAADGCGNTSTAAFSVTVACSGCALPPVITCPADVTVCPVTGSTNPSSTGFATATAGDPSCGAPLISYGDVMLSIGPCPGSGVIQRTWIATDPDDATNFATCIQMIHVEDNTSPTINNCPSNITVSTNDPSCTTAVSWTLPTASDNCSVSSLTAMTAAGVAVNSGDLFNAGVTTVIYTAADICNNLSTCSFNVTVNCVTCSTPPVITCPSDLTLCVNADTNPTATGFATAVSGSALCPDPTLTYQDQVVSTGSCPAEQTIHRTWIAEYPGYPGLTASCVQVIQLSDDSAPTLSWCPSDVTVSTADASCTAGVSWTVPTATDDCGIASLVATLPSGAVVLPGDIFSEGTSNITYTATDYCNNTATCVFNVTVECIGCNEAPAITCPPDAYLCVGASTAPSVLGFATAVAGSANCPSPQVSFSDAIISTGPCPGEKLIHRTWVASYSTSSGLTSSCVQIIHLFDYTPPQLSYCPSDVTVTTNSSNCTAGVSWTVPTATDNCNVASLVATTQTGAVVHSGDTFGAGTTTITYTAMDNCGNTATCSFTITVDCQSCNTPPSINCPANQYLCIGANTDPSQTGYATATPGSGACSAPQISFTDFIASTGPCAGQKVIHRVWKAYQSENPSLMSTCTQVIHLKDDHAPVVSYCPSDITVSSSSGVVSWTPPVFIDNCGFTVTSTHAPGTNFPIGTTTVTYTATDQCGQVAYCTFTVTVDNPTPLVCPNDIVVSCTTNGGAYVDWDPPVYGGTCNNCSTGNYIPGFIYMGSFNGHEYYCSLLPATWPNARTVSESYGGYLAVINSAAENAFLANLITAQTAWIGLSDYASEGQFTWANGDPVTYTNWYPGQPNNYNNNQDYVELLSNGQWNDQYNHYQLEYIMEIPCEYVTQVSGPAPGSFLSAGTYTVTYQASDACGYYSTCSFTITVEEGLTMECPDDIYVPNNSAGSGQTVTWDPPTASSCCSSCGNGSYIPGFIYMGQYQGHHYYCSTGADTWLNAQAVCAANGGHLATVGSSGENNFIASQLITQSAYIGLSDHENEGDFVWVNGEPLVYTNWYTGQPNNYAGSQHFVEMLNNGQWNDQYGNTLLEYVMEISSCVNINQVAGPPPGSTFPNGTSTTITYEATDGCGNLSTCSFDVIVNSNYCPSGGQNSAGSYIKSITFGLLVNSSGDDGGYGNYTHICKKMIPGHSYVLHLTPGFGNEKPAMVYWKVWVDYNMDDDYNDPGEMIAYGHGASTLSGIVTIPSSIPLGETSMRVAMKKGSYPTGPCEIFDYGETEDYCLGFSTLFKDDDLPVENRVADNDGVELFEAQQSTFEVYPNPTQQIFNVEVKDAQRVKTIYIMTKDGSTIRTLDDIRTINQVHLKNMPGGTYLVVVRYIDGTLSTQQVLIQN